MGCKVLYDFRNMFLQFIDFGKIGSPFIIIFWNLSTKYLNRIQWEWETCVKSNVDYLLVLCLCDSRECHWTNFYFTVILDMFSLCVTVIIDSCGIFSLFNLCSLYWPTLIPTFRISLGSLFFFKNYLILCKILLNK